jgi:DNA-nicking Smr family endonuclease
VKSLRDLSQLKAQIAAREAEAKRAQAEALERAKAARAAQRVFAEAVKDVQPLKVAAMADLKTDKPLPIPVQSKKDEEAVLREAISDEFDTSTLLETDADLSFRQPGIGEDVLRRLRRGEWTIQAELDLHGLRTDEAREAVGTFLREAIKRGLRCVRVVHGKGLGSAFKEPVLKRKVRTWLIQKQEVMAFCQAKPQEGGAGALVVLLKGRV